MDSLSYVRARSLQEAVELLAEPGVTSRVLAGGTDLVGQLRSGAVVCDRVVDVAHVPELCAVEIDGPTYPGRISIGAAVTHAEIADSVALRRRLPIVTQACAQIGSPQIRNVGTIGGNVANAAACADTLPVLVCLDAVAVVCSAAGERLVPVTELVTGVNRTLLAKDSLIRAFLVVPPPPGSRMSFQRIGRRQAMSIARLSVAAIGKLDERKRVSLLHLAPGAAFSRCQRATCVEQVLVGRQPSPELIADAGERMAALFAEASGGRWSAPYKVQAIAALTRRALQEVLA